MTIDEFYELATATDTAEECLESLRFGSHYALKLLLKSKYGIVGGSRKDTIKKARQLCNEFITAYSAES